MRPLLFSAFLFSLATAASAQTATRFDLVCSGTETTFGSDATKADEKRFTIDLSAKRWCYTHECREATQIAGVTPDEIALVRSEEGALIDHQLLISRIQGTYTDLLIVPGAGHGSQAKGNCRLAPFSGFPKAKF